MLAGQTHSHVGFTGAGPWLSAAGWYSGVLATVYARAVKTACSRLERNSMPENVTTELEELAQASGTARSTPAAIDGAVARGDSAGCREYVVQQAGTLYRLDCDDDNDTALCGRVNI